MPQAFKQEPDNEEETAPEDWPFQTEALKKKFAKFDAEMAKAQKERSALTLLQALLQYKDIILELP